MNGVAAYGRAWRLNAAVTHRDISLNYNFIQKRVSDDRTAVHVGVLCDSELCKYREQMKLGTDKRQPRRSVGHFLFVDHDYAPCL